jgi:hypothetical protein
MLAVADYLRSNPEILIVMDWIKTRRIDLNVSPAKDLTTVFSGLPIIAECDKELSPGWVSHWVLFLVVNTLMHASYKTFQGGRFHHAPWKDMPKTFKTVKLSNEPFRRVFKFLALGVEG